MFSKRREFIFSVGVLLLASFTVSAAPFQAGQIFIAYGSNNVGVFADTVSLKGTSVQKLSISPSGFTTSSASLAGGGVALDEFGNLYVTVQYLSGTNQNRGIIKFNRDGSIAWRADSGGSLDYRGIVASASLDRVFVATAGGRGASGIHVYRASNGEKIAEFGGTLAYRDLALDGKGNLYALRHNEVRFWSAGNFSGLGTSLFPIPEEDPRAIVADEDGNIYISFEDTKVVRKYSSKGTLLATYLTPGGVGSLFGLDYDPGTKRLFASHTGTGVGQILWIERNASDGAVMKAFGPKDLSGVRWLAVYPTPEPTTAMLLAVGLLLLKRRLRKG